MEKKYIVTSIDYSKGFITLREIKVFQPKDAETVQSVYVDCKNKSSIKYVKLTDENKTLSLGDTVAVKVDTFVEIL